ncbi:PREDICTED: uncharacterized protein LOC105556880 [Vollenhovia emeryi]|uniref:uncharacterized protein LOC105556880 n=1 Tax=Vollenhovia emeryi TaxID=411798 RepID=UPI0005F3A7E7|nr:PREDICTED: uncharacterized protein LOC105556880 [Vollenhovia emeryi]
MPSQEAICVTEEEKVYLLLFLVPTFTWTKQATKLFLEAYFEKKEQFRDPKIRKKSLWIQMCNTMLEQGYNVNEDILDRKMRNMKKTYRTIKDNNKKSSTGRGRVTWDYFDTFEDIFRNDATINHGPTLSSMVNPIPSTTTDKNVISSILIDENSMPSTSTNKSSISSVVEGEQTKPSGSNDKPMSLMQDQMISTAVSSSESISSPCSDKENKRSRMKMLSSLRKKQLDIESNRIQEIKKLQDAIMHSNTIQEENNNILKERNALLKDILLEMRHKK